MKMYKIEMKNRDKAYMYAYGETMVEALEKAIPCCDEVVSCNPTDVKMFCIVKMPRTNDDTFRLYYQGIYLPVKAKSLETIEYALSKYTQVVDDMFNNFELFDETYLEMSNKKISIRNAIPKEEKIKCKLVWMEV